MQTNFTMNKIHYYGTWESPPSPLGQWHIEIRGDKYFCFWNNKIMHHIYEAKTCLGEAIKLCEDHYHELMEAHRVAKLVDKRID